MNPLHRSLPGLTAGGFLALLAGCAHSTDSFAKLDTNRDGSGSPVEFDSYMKAEVFTRVDTNRDAKVTQAEWRQSNPQVSNTKFRNTDTNRDAAISRPEADAGFDREGSLKKLFDKIDSDRDGHLDRAEVKTFQAKVAQAPESSHAEKTPTATTQP